MRGSRNNGLLSAAFFCRSGDFLVVINPGLVRPPFVLDTTGLTPNACTARQDETTMEVKSFMAAILIMRSSAAGVTAVSENVEAKIPKQEEFN